jgi:hypothetical protein
MKREETKMLLAKIQMLYPFVYKDYDDAMSNLAVDTWHSFFEELDVRVVFGVVSKIIAINETRYPPTIAEILKEYQKAINPSAFISPEQAWVSVKNAIKKFGYYRESEALASLSANAEKAVKTIGWRNLCMADDKQFDFMRKNFVESYKQVETDERHSLVNPQGANRFMDIVKNMQLPDKYKHLIDEKKDEN